MSCRGPFVGLLHLYDTGGVNTQTLMIIAYCPFRLNYYPGLSLNGALFWWEKKGYTGAGFNVHFMVLSDLE